MYLLKLSVEICVVTILTSVSARPRDDYRPADFNPEDEKQLEQFIGNLNISSNDEQLHGIVHGLLEGKGDINEYLTKTLGDIYQLNEHVNEESETNYENQIESEQNNEQRPEETYGDIAGLEKKLDRLERLLDIIQYSTNKSETMNLNRNIEEEIKRMNPFNSSINELEKIIGLMSLDNSTEVSDGEKLTENDEKAMKEPFEQNEYEANSVNDNKGIKEKGDNVEKGHEIQTDTKFHSELTLSHEIEKNITEEGEQNDDGKHVDKSNITVDNRMTESQEHLAILRGHDEELFVKITTIQNDVDHDNVSNMSVIMTSPSLYLKETEPVGEARNLNFDINEEKIKTDSETKSTTRSLDVVNDKTVHPSDELYGRISDPAKGAGVSNEQVENRKFSSVTTKENNIASEEFNQNVNTENYPIVIDEVTTSHDSFITKEEAPENKIYSKNNEEIFAEGSVAQTVGNNNNPLNRPDHPSNIEEVTDDIKHDLDATNEEEENEPSLNQNFVTLTSDVSDNANRDNKVRHTTTKSGDSAENVPTKTNSGMEKDAITIATKQDPVHDIPLSFHRSEGKVIQQTTKRKSIPTKTPVRRSKLEETPNNDSDLSNEHVLETEENIVEDIERHDDKPCNCIRDPELMYNGSALIAATVGGIFIGGFIVLLLFKTREKCKRYIQGDYRRVPMEYDFELNPRLKTH